MRRYLIAGNWKMNTTVDSAAKLATDILTKLSAGVPPELVEVALFPPYTNIPSVAPLCRSTQIRYGAQNCSHESYGAYTGDVSIEMLEAMGCAYVLVGHSERRTVYRENTEWLAAKVKLALSSKVTPIYCIGETLEQRQTNKTWTVLADQLDLIFKSIDPKSAQRVVVAYEPVWAIGTGVAATKEEAQEAHAFIRAHLQHCGVHQQGSERTMLLYGGSVTAENAKSLLEQADIDGALIGGASLKADAFVSIILDALGLASSQQTSN